MTGVSTDILADVVAHWDEVVPCAQRGCEAEATVMCIHRCDCGNGARNPACEPCYRKHRSQVVNNPYWHCKGCLKMVKPEHVWSEPL